MGPLRILDAIKLLGLENHTKFYQASTSELYGLVHEIPQTEKTPFHPRSPYAVAKLYAYWITINYREAYGIYACNGILFNHESPKEEGVCYKKNNQIYKNRWVLIHAYISGFDAKRDWGHAKDYVEMQWLMLQQDKPDDYVIATGKMETVRRFVELSAEKIGWQKNKKGPAILWEGNGVNEIGRRADTNQIVVKIDPKYFRPTEVELLLGDATKAKEKLGWQYNISLEELISEMINHDLKEAKKDVILKESGYKQNNPLETIPDIMEN